MPDNEQQSKKYTLPNNGQGWEIGNVITADRMNAISNALAFTSEEIDNAVNGTIYDNENNNILARKLDGLIKCFTQNTYTDDDLKYTRFYTLPFTGEEMTYEVPTLDEFNTFTTQKNQEFNSFTTQRNQEYNAFTNTINTAYNIFKQSFARPYSKDNRYEKGTYVEYNGQIYKLLVPIPAKTTAQDNDAAWNSISNNNKQQITIMQELGGLINIYTDEGQLTQETNKIWINTQNNEVEVPTYEEFSELKSAYNDTLDLLEAIKNALIDEEPEEATNLINTFLTDHGELASYNSGE